MSDNITTIVITPSKGRANIDWGELWRYRELLFFLTWRDIKVRYKQTALGAAWAVLQPLMTMLVFTAIFGRLAGLANKTGAVPYHIYVFAGLLPWLFFANSVTTCGSSVVGSANLVTKVYFPRLIIPLAAVGVALVDLAVSLAVLVAMMLIGGITPTWQIVFVPILLLGTVLVATGVGMLFAALTVSYRDFRYVVPFMIQIWMFLSPVIYPPSIVPERWRWALALNPMAGLIEGFRSAFLPMPFHWGQIGVSLTVSAVLFFIGASFFRSTERRFADLI